MDIKHSKNCNSLPFITHTPKKGYQINEKAIQFLRSLPNEDNYSVMTIVGKSKTGKSYFMNQIIQDNKMFPVSNNIDNESKGIMISTKLMHHEDKKIILLDVEGFGSIQGTDDRDCKFFILSILLSSLVIYNSIGTIDQQSLNNLSMVIEVGKILQKQLVKPNMFPALVWILRDFSLKMQDKNGNIISSKQYLQNALDEQRGQSQSIYHKNRIRRIIKALFTQRTCQTAVIPSQQLLTSAQNSICRPQFIQDLKRIKSKLTKMIDKKGCKQFCGVSMTRDSFINAAKVYTQALNRSVSEGNLPKIENITFQLRKTQAKGILDKFNEFLNAKKQQIITQLSAIKKQADQKQYLQYFQKIMQPIQNLFGSSLQNIHALSGQIQEQELVKIRNMFYEIIQKEIESGNEDLSEMEEQQLRLANICEYFSHISEENELEKEYFSEIKELRSKYVEKNSMYFSNLLMKLEIAYLRRKLELSKQHNLQIDRLSIELSYSKKEIQRLTNRNKELESQMFTYAKQSRAHSYNTPNKNISMEHASQAKYIGHNNNVRSFKNYSTTHKEYLKENNTNTNTNVHTNSNTNTNTKIESISFYLPYVMIEKSQYLHTKIIRTLIKEDSRRNSYIQYVIEVALLDQKWVLNRKFKDFSELHSILVMMFQDDKLPSCTTITGCVQLLESNPHIRKQIVEQRRRELQNYMGDLIQIESIRNSRILQKFLKINKEYTVL